MVFQHVANAHVEELTADVMYHLGLTYSKDDAAKTQALFGDTKFFITGGSNGRMSAFAKTAAQELGLQTPFGFEIAPIGSTSRYVIYKVGPLLIASHGMGMPSVSILLHEVTKLLEYAGAHDVVYLRMGTSGGVGVEPGTVVITSEGVNNKMESVHAVDVLDKTVQRASICSPHVTEALALAAKQLSFEYAVGKTLTCDDFYEGQGRLDGAVCEYTLQDKMDFLHKASDAGVKNIEMEARGFAAFCYRLNIPVGVACVALLNRLNGDQVLSSHETLVGYEERPAAIVLRYVKNTLSLA